VGTLGALERGTRGLKGRAGLEPLSGNAASEALGNLSCSGPRCQCSSTEDPVSAGCKHTSAPRYAGTRTDGLRPGLAVGKQI